MRVLSKVISSSAVSPLSIECTKMVGTKQKHTFYSFEVDLQCKFGSIFDEIEFVNFFKVCEIKVCMVESKILITLVLANKMDQAEKLFLSDDANYIDDLTSFNPDIAAYTVDAIEMHKIESKTKLKILALLAKMGKDGLGIKSMYESLTETTANKRITVTVPLYLYRKLTDCASEGCKKSQIIAASLDYVFAEKGSEAKVIQEFINQWLKQSWLRTKQVSENLKKIVEKQEIPKLSEEDQRLIDFKKRVIKQVASEEQDIMKTQLGRELTEDEKRMIYANVANRGTVSPKLKSKVKPTKEQQVEDLLQKANEM